MYAIRSYYDNQGSSLIYHKGYLWGGDTKGIVRIRKVYWNWWEEDGLLTSESTNNALKSDLVTSIVADNYGQIWVGTRGGGVHIITLV